MASRWQFRVTGSTPFPLDMLRYDACYPIGLDSIDGMQARDPGEVRVPVTVTLASFISAPSDRRWSSFGWNVTDVKRERVTI